MAHYNYKALNRSANEIRMLKFPYPPTSEADRVRCTLQHVSLDQLLPAYEEYKAECRHLFPRKLSRGWLESYFSSDSWPEHKTSTLVITASRYRAESEPLYELSFDQIAEDGTVSVPPRFKWGDFEALSYCWESEVRDKTILIDDLPVQVPTNFEAMLRHIQHLPEARSGMGFWADGLCINQLDVPEKESQIQLMKRIYSQALATVVWLGPGGLDSDRAVDDMNTFFGECRPAMAYGEDDEWTVSSSSKHDILRADWHAILNLWSRSYFKRMWIIQELALNKCLTLFICGSRKFPRITLQAASKWAGLYTGAVSQAATENVSRGPTSNQFLPDDIWRVSANVLVLTTLSAISDDRDKMFDLARKSQVKELHDKIYGLLGLLPDHIAARIKPDYSKPRDDVFAEFAKLMLEDCKRLDEILSWCTFREQDTSPSWVPDWTIPHERNHLQWFRKQDAGDRKYASWKLMDDGRRLSTPGIRIDEVDFASLPHACALSYQETSQSEAQTPRYDSICGRYLDSQSLKAAFMRTLLHDHPMRRSEGDITDICWIDWNQTSKSSSKMYKLETEHGVAHQWRLFDRFRHTNADFPIFGSRLRDFFPETIDRNIGESMIDLTPRRIASATADTQANQRKVSDSLTLDSSSVRSDTVTDGDTDHAEIDFCIAYNYTEDHAWNLQLAVVALHNRRLVTTRSGFLGLAPDEVQRGDVVAVLLGCNYPVVLRPHADGYRYVGEVYVDGLMGGEAIEAADRGEYEVQDILIL